MSVLFFVASAFFLAYALSLMWRRKYFHHLLGEKISHDQMLRHVKALSHRHPTAAWLKTLIDEDGAGSWPPRVDHDNWPAALRPYKEIYLQAVPLLSADSPSVGDDTVNIEHRNMFRSLMRKLLAERVNTADVEHILATVEAGDWSVLPRDAYNGFYCCVAVCRHAYRWAMIPVVKVAQCEKIVDFPPELDGPWPYLQRMFGCDADAGNNTANVVHNFDSRGNRVYRINVGMSDLIRSSEDVFFKVFHDLEVNAVPLYHSMVMANISFDSGDKRACVRHILDIVSQLRHLLLVFYENLHEQRISKSVWLSYIQGFQGWGVGRMIDGEFVKYDGLSGNHVLVFQALDAFLGIEQYLTEENMLRYIPRNQRELCYAFRQHNIRQKLQPDNKDDEEIKQHFAQIVKQMRVFRAAHRARVIPYLEQPAPERLPMTAGKSVLHGDTIQDALSVLDDMMAQRFEVTV